MTDGNAFKLFRNNYGLPPFGDSEAIFNLRNKIIAAKAEETNTEIRAGRVMMDLKTPHFTFPDGRKVTFTEEAMDAMRCQEAYLVDMMVMEEFGVVSKKPLAQEKLTPVQKTVSGLETLYNFIFTQNGQAMPQVAKLMAENLGHFVADKIAQERGRSFSA